MPQPAVSAPRSAPALCASCCLSRRAPFAKRCATSHWLGRRSARAGRRRFPSANREVFYEALSKPGHPFLAAHPRAATAALGTPSVDASALSPCLRRRARGVQGGLLIVWRSHLQARLRSRRRSLPKSLQVAIGVLICLAGEYSMKLSSTHLVGPSWPRIRIDPGGIRRRICKAACDTAASACATACSRIRSRTGARTCRTACSAVRDVCRQRC
jgi:hypothetical protein